MTELSSMRVTMELFGGAVCLFAAIVSWTWIKKDDYCGRILWKLMIVGVVYLLADGMYNRFRIHPDSFPTILADFCNILIFYMPSTMLCYISRYVQFRIENNEKHKPKIWVWVNYILANIVLIVVVVTVIYGDRAPVGYPVWYMIKDYYIIYPLLVLGQGMWLIFNCLRNWKQLTRRLRLTLVIAFVLPAITLILQGTFYDFNFVNISVIGMILTLYISYEIIGEPT